MLPVSGEEESSVFVFSHLKVKKVASSQKQTGHIPIDPWERAEHWRWDKIEESQTSHLYLAF